MLWRCGRQRSMNFQRKWASRLGSRWSWCLMRGSMVISEMGWMPSDIKFDLLRSEQYPLQHHCCTCSFSRSSPSWVRHVFLRTRDCSIEFRVSIASIQVVQDTAVHRMVCLLLVVLKRHLAFCFGNEKNLFLIGCRSLAYDRLSQIATFLCPSLLTHQSYL